MIFLYSGITVAVKEQSTKKIRVFPLLPASQTQPRLRSNTTYDEIVNIDDDDDKPTDHDQLVEMMRGHVGQCALRDLRYLILANRFSLIHFTISIMV